MRAAVTWLGVGFRGRLRLRVGGGGHLARVRVRVRLEGGCYLVLLEVLLIY